MRARRAAADAAKLEVIDGDRVVVGAMIKAQTEARRAIERDDCGKRGARAAGRGERAKRERRRGGAADGGRGGGAVSENRLRCGKLRIFEADFDGGAARAANGNEHNRIIARRVELERAAAVAEIRANHRCRRLAPLHAQIALDKVRRPRKRREVGEVKRT